MQSAAIPYAVFQISGTAGAVGVTGLFQYLPFMIMGAVGGTLADRHARRPLLLLSQVAQMVAALALWGLVASGRATVASITVVAFCSGLLGGLATPIWQSFVAELVPRDMLLGAVTLNSTQFNAARAVGPFLAGVVIAAWGVSAAFLLNAVSFLAVVGVLMVIRSAGARRRPARNRAPGPSPAWPRPAATSCTHRRSSPVASPSPRWPASDRPCSASCRCTARRSST